MSHLRPAPWPWFGAHSCVVGIHERKSVSLDSPLTSGNGSEQPAASSRDGAVVPHLLLVSNTRSFSFFLI